MTTGFFTIFTISILKVTRQLESVTFSYIYTNKINRVNTVNSAESAEKFYMLELLIFLFPHLINII